MSMPIPSSIPAPDAGAVAPPAPTRRQAAVADKSEIAVSAESATAVTFSVQAQTQAAAAHEAMETPAQTAQEARGNDHQAQRLLAKEAAMRQAYA